MLGQPVSMLIPRVVGFKLTGEIKPGVTATDVVLTVTEMLRKHGVVGKFVEFYGEGVAEVPLANRATLGNMSPEFGSTAAIFPIDEVTIDYLRLTGRTDEQLALVEAYAKAQGMWHDPEPRARCSPSTSSWTCPTWCRRSPDPSARRTASRSTDAKIAFRKDIHNYVEENHPAPEHQARRGRRGVLPGQRPGVAVLRRRRRGRRCTRRPTAPRAGRPSRSRCKSDERGEFVLDHGAVVDRRHHVVHQHLQPVGDARRGAAGPQRRREGPDLQAVGQDHDGARLAGRHRLLREGRPVAVPGEAGLLPGRLRLHHLHRQHRPAARRDLEGDQRQRPVGDRGAVGQPQLRGPHLPRRQDELPGLAAAGDRLRARRHHGLRLRDRPARARTPTATTSSSRTSGRRRRRSPTPSPRRSTRRCSPTATPTCSRATSAGATCRPRRATPSSGIRSRPTCASPRTSTACPPSRSRSPTSPAPECLPCWAIR